MIDYPRTAGAFLAIAAFAVPLTSHAGPAAPDLVLSAVGKLHPSDPGIKRWGSESGTTAYTFGIMSCNAGDANMPWNGSNADHPVLAQNIYRLHGGRLEQIGAAPAKHVSATIPFSDQCSTGCDWPGSFVLGTGCSDPYDANRNGLQFSIGPRYEINPMTGATPYPYTGLNVTGGALDKRIRIRNADLDPASYPGARYFIEAIAVSEAETQAGGQSNNISYSEVRVGEFDGEGWDLISTGGTSVGAAAIEAWTDSDDRASFTSATTPDGGTYLLGSAAHANPDGSWRYEYALLNFNDHLAAGGFAVPVSGCAPFNIGFHAPEQDPIENIGSGGWASTTGETVEWATEPFASNPDANALRWGLTFSFWFDSHCEPAVGNALIRQHGPGGADQIPIYAVIPDVFSACPADLADPLGVLDLADIQAFVTAFTGTSPAADLDGNGIYDLADIQAFIAAFTAGCP